MHGQPIQEVKLRDVLKVGISYSPSFEQYLSCTEAKMDWERWNSIENPYPTEIMASAIVGYRMKRLIEAHTQAAQNAAQRKAAKRKK
jgi:hypothetical protein